MFIEYVSEIKLRIRIQRKGENRSYPQHENYRYQVPGIFLLQLIYFQGWRAEAWDHDGEEQRGSGAYRTGMYRYIIP
jgi:hypothetical protein